jgi:hypothetical protein
LLPPRRRNVNVSVLELRTASLTAPPTQLSRPEVMARRKVSTECLAETRLSRPVQPICG